MHKLRKELERLEKQMLQKKLSVNRTKQCYDGGGGGVVLTETVL